VHFDLLDPNQRNNIKPSRKELSDHKQLFLDFLHNDAKLIIVWWNNEEQNIWYVECLILIVFFCKMYFFGMFAFIGVGERTGNKVGNRGGWNQERTTSRDSNLVAQSSIALHVHYTYKKNGSIFDNVNIYKNICVN